MNCNYLKLYLVLFCLLPNLLIVPELMAEKQEKVNSKKVILASEEWLPYTSANLKHGGVLLHIVKEAFKISGYDVEYKILPTKRAIDLSRHGKVDGFAVWGGYDWFSSWDHYGSDYILSIPYVYYQKKGKPINWANPKEMKGLKIAIRLGDEPSQYLKDLEKKKIISIETPLKNINALSMLALDRVDLVPIQSTAADYLIKSGKLKKEFANKIMVNPNPERVSLYRVIFPYKQLSSQRLQELLQALNHGIFCIKTTGEN